MSAHGKKNRGFTLVELLVVIAIIAVLLTILVPALSKARELAKRAICASNMRNIFIGLTYYAEDDNDKLPPLFNYWSAAPHFTRYAVDPYNSVSFNYIQLGRLYDAGSTDDAEVFYCPSQPSPYHRYDTFVNSPDRIWGEIPAVTNKWNVRVRVGYNYFPQKKGIPLDYWLGPVDEQEVPARKMTLLDQNKALLTDILETSPEEGAEPLALVHSPTRAKEGWTTSDVIGLNACFGDGHVSFSQSGDAFAPHLWDPGSGMGPGTNIYQFGTIISLLNP